MKAIPEAVLSAKTKAASKARAKASEVIYLESSLVMTADGSMKKASEEIDIPPAATCPRSVKMNKGTGEVNIPVPCKPVTDEKTNFANQWGEFLYCEEVTKSWF